MQFVQNSFAIYDIDFAILCKNLLQNIITDIGRSSDCCSSIACCSGSDISIIYGNTAYGIEGIAIGYAVSPYGIPKLAVLLLARLYCMFGNSVLFPALITQRTRTRPTTVRSFLHTPAIQA